MWLHPQGADAHGARLSFDAASVLEARARATGRRRRSRFHGAAGPREPFALIAKPCDIAAVRNLARIDPRVDRYLRYALTFVCGGASDLTKSEEVASELGIRPDELALFRYRGYGCPGLTRLTTQDGRSFELTYQEMWEDEATWGIQPRCKICPDAIGESADLAASDVWPGGGPTGESEGFNGIIVRTARGPRTLPGALEAAPSSPDRRGELPRLRWIPAAPSSEEARGLGAFGGDEGRGPPVPNTRFALGGMRSNEYAGGKPG